MTIKNGDLPAMPTQVNGGDLYGGLTKREQFAMAAMQSLIASLPHYERMGYVTPDARELISDAYVYADAAMENNQ
jgi:hypothetical protein